MTPSLGGRGEPTGISVSAGGTALYQNSQGVQGRLVGVRCEGKVLILK